ncbi:MAG: ArsR family transcriptional regulator, partial [Agromyces sp.]
VAARLVQDVGALITGADRQSKRLATFALDGEIRFATAADRAAFAEELSAAAMGLVSRYHDASAANGREYRLVVALHPSATPSRSSSSNEQAD